MPQTFVRWESLPSWTMDSDIPDRNDVAFVLFDDCELLHAIALGSTATVSATGGYSGNSVIFTSQTTDKCSLGNSTVSGNTSSVTVSGISAGTCIIAANQTGNDNYNPALPKTLSFEVTMGKALDLFLNLFMLSLLPYNMVFKPYNK